jgi:hypothetical protein
MRGTLVANNDGIRPRSAGSNRIKEHRVAMVKAYWTIWIMFLAAAALLFAAGLMGGLMLTAFGFIAFGLVFAGMICVLPTTLAHLPAEHSEVAPTLTLDEERKAPAFGVLKSV